MLCMHVYVFWSIFSGCRVAQLAVQPARGPLRAGSRRRSWVGAWLQRGISTEVPLALFQMALATRAIKFMAEQLAGKIGSRVKHFGARWGNRDELHLGHAGV